MSLILNLETSTKNCSVCLAKQGEIVSLEEVNTGQYSHAEQLHPMIEKVLKSSNINYDEIDAIAVSKGPGSYTGLRIGVSAAKGLCFALNKPLISVDTLTSLSHVVNEGENGFIIPMIDARRMEVYSAVFDEKHQMIRQIKAEVVTDESYYEYLERGIVYFVGDAVEKCEAIINHKNAVFIKNEFPSAKQMAKLSYEKHKKNDIEDVAYFEPFYLKDFVVIPEKKKKPIF